MGERWRLGHRPGLDGLRGVAIGLVVAFHILGSRFPAGGLVGVTLFFALSGFLITSLLLEERERTGGVSFRRFYWRRFLRLGPALIVVTLIGLALTIPAGQNHPGDALVVLGYSANWWQATGHSLGWFTHTWSLATEEQFYLVWPVVLTWLCRRGHARTVVTALAVGVPLGRLGLEAAGASESLIYYTGGDALLAGSALALWMHGTEVRRGRPALVLAALAALVASSWLTLSTARLLLIVTAASVVAVYGLAVSQPRLLTWSPLVAVGRRSYGLYLWHVPIIGVVGLFGTAAGIPMWQHSAIALVLVALVTEASWRFVEQPFLRRRLVVTAPAARGHMLGQTAA